MSKFTSGTWSVGINGKYGPYVYADDGNAIIAVIRSCGHISESNAKDAVRRANARLIAAAPEMYELLKGIIQSTADCPMESAGFFREARELLARIDGEEAAHE